MLEASACAEPGGVHPEESVGREPDPVVESNEHRRLLQGNFDVGVDPVDGPDLTRAA